MKNKSLLYVFAGLLILVFGLYAAILGITYMQVDNEGWQIAIIIASSVMLFTISFIILMSFFILKRKRQEIRKAFDFYVEELMSTSGVGMIMYDEEGQIFWTSQFIENRLEKSLIGTRVHAITEEFGSQFIEGKKVFRFLLDGLVFEAKIFSESKSIVIRDVTTEDMLLKQYSNEKIVIGEIEIDNFQQFQVILPEEELFKVQANVIKTLDEMVEKYGLAYRQYVNGKYIIISDNRTLKDLMSTNFNFLDKIRATKMIDGLKLTASAGFGFGSSSQRELIELAKDGLMQAQARGGDQVAVVELNKRPQYFGSKVEAAKTSSRVKIKQVAELLEEKLSSKDINNVIIYGHKFADLDAMGSALGMYDFAKAFDKEVYIQNETFDGTTLKNFETLHKDYQNIFIKTSKAQKLTNSKTTLVIIVDTAELDRIENPEAIEGLDLNNVFILDHHRVSKLPENIPAQNMYIDTSASSASEIVCEVLQFAEKFIKLSKVTAQQLLNGIYLDTKLFTKSMSSRTFAAAAWLEKYGALSSVSVDILKLPQEYAQVISEVISKAREVRQGYFLAAYDGEIPSDIISIIADEILRTQGRKAAFVVAKTPGKKEYKMSARGIETNVQLIAESVGGGGHFGASAAISEEPLSIFVDNIVQAIASHKEGQ